MKNRIVEAVARSPRHKSFFISAGARGAPLIFVHGWPELGMTWEHQIEVFGNLGFRAIAPDMRGYGRSDRYSRIDDYRLSEILTDLIELLDWLGEGKAVWIGHDLGAAAVWGLAQHHPDRCLGAAGICVPYIPNGFAAENLIALANRSVYPEAEFPAAQWDYQLYYHENFEAAVAELDADVGRTVRAQFRAGDFKSRGRPPGTAFVRRNKGRHLVDLPRDNAVLNAQDEARYVEALTTNGFFGPCSWYMNDAANIDYALRASATWRLPFPVLFVHAEFDQVCDTLDSALANPMREYCPDLTEAIIRSGHWVPHEKPIELNAVLARWLGRKLPGLWLGAA